MMALHPYQYLGHMVLVLLLCLAIGCCSSKKDFYAVQTFAQDGTVHAVIEIPAGTNKKLEYNTASNTFIVDQYQNQDRVIDFLPYPGNYGFIPSTFSDPFKGGDGDALDVLVISETLKTGTLVKTIPIALLKLIDDGELDYKVIAVPVKPKDRVTQALNYAELEANYEGLIRILEIWFLNYNRKEWATIEGWGDEIEAMEEIKKHLKAKRKLK